MNQQTELAKRLLAAWLSQFDPFDYSLVDSGQTYYGKPVFYLGARFPGDEVYTVKVYRWTPNNSQYPILSFVPEGN